MAYDLKFTLHENYLRMDIAGHRIPGKEVMLMVEAISRLTEEIRNTGMEKILVVSTLTGRAPTQVIYQLSQLTTQYRWKKEYKLSIVDTNEDSYRDNMFTQVIADDRGFLLKFFRDEKNALEWLLNTE